MRSILSFQQLTQEKDMSPKSFSLEEYITIFYHIQNLKANVNNI